MPIDCLARDDPKRPKAPQWPVRRFHPSIYRTGRAPKQGVSHFESELQASILHRRLCRLIPVLVA